MWHRIILSFLPFVFFRFFHFVFFTEYVAGDEGIIPNRLQGRGLGFAKIIGKWTTWVKSATRGWIHGIRDLTADGFPGEPGHLQIWNGIEKHARVGMAWVLKQGLDGGYLHHPAQVHDTDTVGDMVDNGKVVANEKVSQFELSLEIFHEVKDLCLNGNIQSGGRFVAYQKLRLAGQGSCDRNPLPLTPREFVGIFLPIGGCEPDMP
jgi:hypothetical protein